MKKFIFIWSCLLLVSFCSAATITVDDDGPADFDNIQAAIDDANSGDVIIVAKGIYTGESNRNIDYRGKTITVQGINPYDPALVVATVIDCENRGRGFYFHSGEEANSALTGLTITNGYASDGGGIYCTSSSPTITHCIITDNKAVSINCDGGGIYLGNSNSTVKHCIITNNSTVGWEMSLGV